MTGLKGVSLLDGYTVSGSKHCVDSNKMTPQLCGNLCSAGGFAYIGLQFGRECFCGWTYGRFGSRPEHSCSMKCTGNSALKCGDGHANSVYALEYIHSNLFKKSPPAYISVSSNLGSECFQTQRLFDPVHHEMPGCALL
uniref:WSC domain-containing protein n=1 Tax=Macrostomum lignano TaxID=282301 RepID=A0A1I8IZG6_9PLAT